MTVPSSAQTPEVLAIGEVYRAQTTLFAAEYLARRHFRTPRLVDPVPGKRGGISDDQM